MAKNQKTKVIPDHEEGLVRAIPLHDQRHDPFGREILDPTPINVPLQYKRPASIFEQVRAQVVKHIAELQDDQPETESEADDFEVGDDFEPLSRWENDFEPSIAELKKRVQELNKQLADEFAAAKAKEEAALKPPTTPSPVQSGDAPSEPALTP